MKYLNIIILSIIIIIIIILIYRWYYGIEGFLTQDDNLVKIDEISNYTYLWSNNLYLSQYEDSTKPEQLIIFQKPKLEGDITGKIIGTTIFNDINNINNNKSIIVNKDVKKPLKLQELFTYNNTSTPLFNKLLKYENITNINSLNENIIKLLEETLLEIDNIGNQLLLNVNNKLNVILYTNGLGDTNNLSSKFILDSKNNSLTFSNKTINRYNAISFPIGSNVSFNRNGRKETIMIPITNIKDENGNIISKENITYNSIFRNTNLNANSFNPFGKNGLGFFNSSDYEAKEELYLKKERNFNYNYSLGDSSQSIEYFKNINLISYLNNIPKITDDSLLSEYSFININNKIFFVNHIVEILPNNIDYDINLKESIYKIIYSTKNSYESKKNKYFRTKCYRKGTYEYNTILNEANIGAINNLCKNKKTGDNGKLFRVDSLGCGLSSRMKRGYCTNSANNDNTFIVEDGNYSTSEFIKDVYVNRKWINKNEYTNEFKNIDFKDSTNTFNYEIIYCSKSDYNNTISKKDLQIPRNITKSIQNNINITSSTNKQYTEINELFNMSRTDLFDIKKRNILACLWYDGEITFENYFNGDSRIKFKWDELIDGKEGPKYSPYVTIRFYNPKEAKYFVANILNKINNEFKKERFNIPTIEYKQVDGFTDILNKTTSNKGNNIYQIKENINNILDNYIKLSEDSSLITGIKDLISSITSYLNSTTINIPYFNFMFSIPIYKIVDKQIVQKEYFDLSNGEIVNTIPNISNVEITITENNNPISNILYTSINKLKQDLTTFKNLFITDNTNYNNIITNINNKTLKHYPLTIYRPISPNNYKCLGDIVGISGFQGDNAIFNINPNQNMDEYGCIPDHCVVNVRPWLISDKIYEYNENGKYLALFRNPFLNTFKAVTVKDALPDGNVEKIVACVAKSKLIDNLRDADDCANKYKDSYNKILNKTVLDRDSLLYDKQEERLQTLLSDRQETINSLQEQIRLVEKQDQQAIIINHSKNRKRFQDLLDSQVYNMDKLINNLYSIISINVNVDDLISKLKSKGITKEKIQEIISTIKRTIPIYSVQTTTTSITTTEEEKDADSNPTPTGTIVQPYKLQKIIYRTHDGKEQEMILRSLVESSCGCYFTDEEIIKTR
jgi:hypothetical protein